MDSFAKKMGYKGLPALKLDLAQDRTDEMPEVDLSWIQKGYARGLVIRPRPFWNRIYVEPMNS